MFAIQDDLSSLSPKLMQPEWFDFDIVIISMALHHVPAPIDLLSQLRKRLTSGGTLLIVEWFYVDLHVQKRSISNPLDPENMIEVVGGQKIWDGFTPDGVKKMLVAAGLRDAELKVLDETVHIPDHAGDTLAGSEKKLMFVKAVA